MSTLQERLAQLSPEKRALFLKKLRAQKQAAAKEEQRIEPADRSQPLPLSYAQQRLWFLAQLEGDSATYNMPTALRLTGAINIDLLERIVNDLLARHEPLRSCFVMRDGQPYQEIAPTLTVKLRVEDIQRLNSAEQTTLVNRLIAEEGVYPFDLAVAPLVRLRLLRLRPDEHVLLVTMHHTIADGWSMGIFIRELTTLYAAYQKGQSNPLPALPVQYADYSQWQREQLRGERLEKQLDYWREKLATAPRLIDLPLDHARPPVQTHDGDGVEVRFSAELTQKLNALSQAHGATLYMTLLAAWSLYLSRITRQAEIVVGSPIANRQRKELEGLIGLFVNTIVLHSDLSELKTFGDLLQQVKKTTLDAYTYQDLPLDLLVDDLLDERHPSHSPLFQVMFVLQNAPGGALQLGELKIETLSNVNDRAIADLFLSLADGKNGITGRLQFNRQLFERSTIERMCSHLEVLLEAIVAQPDTPIRQLALLTDQERQHLLQTWNDTVTPYPTDKTIVQLFEEQVERTPNQIALVYQTKQLTYRQLNQRINQLAHYLQAHGVKSEMLVSIYMERSVEMVIAIWAILKAGGAYVPLDPSLPAERLAFMVDEIAAPFVLTQAALPLEGEHHCLAVDGLEATLATYSDENLNQSIHPTHLAYCIYTSGSTGRPKGVLNEHGGILNRLQWMQETYQLGVDDVILQKTPYGFDVSVWEFLWPFMTGARLVVAEPDGHKDPEYLIETIIKEQVTTIHFVPSMLQAFLRSDVGRCTSLRRVICSGEALPAESVAQFFAVSGAELHNLYGPTEAAIDVSWYHCLPAALPMSIPIGKPIANTQLYILDELGQIVPQGVAGELHIGGVQVARGYLNRPNLSAERFINNPFAAGRLYKTGDLCRYLPDGNIEFLGRIDHQVKIRGFRIELGEIEAVMTQHPAVEKVIVRPYNPPNGSTQLAAYFVPAAADATIQQEQLEQWEAVADDAYQSKTGLEDDDGNELTFDLSGWISSYSDALIPEQEMAEWVDVTVAEILALQPQTVLEIGCGTGLLLSRIAPHVQRFVGLDHSAVSIAQIEQIKHHHAWEHVTAMQRRADELADFADQQFDTIIINSVIQYFPSLNYLQTVVDNALRLLKPNGNLFIGDVRSYPHLEAYHASVQLYRADDTVSRALLQARIAQRMQQEEELLVDPHFFSALQTRHPNIAAVDVHVKRGQAHNELTRFRYQVVIKKTAASVNGHHPSFSQLQWADWSADNLTVTAITARLKEQQPAGLAITNIPDARLADEARLLNWLRDANDETVGEWRQRETTADAIDPETLFALGETFGYLVDLRWGDANHGSVLTALFKRDPALTLPFSSNVPQTVANNPLHGKLYQSIVPALRAHLQARLPDYMLPTAYQLLDVIPLTSNGKVNYRALPQPVFRPNASQLTLPRNPTEQAVLTIWRTVLGNEQIGVHDNFFEMGGHSLLATQVVARMRQQLGHELPLRALFEQPTVARLVATLETPVARADAITRADRTQPLPLSFAQQRLWFLDQLAGANAAYNIPLGMRVLGQLDSDALERSINTLLERHEVFRTQFVTGETGTPVQVIVPVLELPLVIEDWQATTAEEQAVRLQTTLATEAQTVFDLTSAPLLRVRAIRLNSAEHILLITFHHIISDGWSNDILVRELVALYTAYRQGQPNPLPPLPLHYADYAAWQRDYLQGEVLDEQIAYWRETLADAPALLALPTDRPRPAVQTQRGDSVPIALSAELSRQLQQLSQTHNVTLFMTLLAAWSVLLSRHSRQEQVVIGSPIANRQRSELESIIGFFVNTLALKADLSGNPTFGELLQQIKQTTLGAYAHQDIPFEKLVERLVTERDMRHSPLFQVMFAWQNTPQTSMQLPDLQIRPLTGAATTAKFDLTLNLGQSAEKITGELNFNSDLFDVTTIERMVGQLEVLLQAIVDAADTPVERLPLLPAAEKTLLLETWNDTIVPAAHDKQIVQLFEEQVERTPDAIAVLLDADGERPTLTYRQLDQRANQLAHWLIAQGVCANRLVGLQMERSLEMVIGCLGVLKAGGGYVPLDPTYPAERLRLIIEDAELSLILQSADIAATKNCPTERVARTIDGQQVAYCLFTSGTTGRPKGVLIPHRALSNHMRWMQRVYPLTAQDRVLHKSPFGFDVSILELYAPLLVGGQLILAKPDGHQDPDYLLALMRQHAITWVSLSPTLLQMMLHVGGLEQCHSLTRLYLGTENLPLTLLQQLHAAHPVEVINAYGPTECCIQTVTGVIPRGADRIAIGRPVDNVQAYILDVHLQPVPLGAAGELHLGGAQVGLGYFKRPQQTAASFIDNPFGAGKLYKTGDLCRYLPNGEIEYLGRIDHQVKIRGFRIELGEIETRLLEHPDVREAVVIVREDTPNDKRLVAYLIPHHAPGTTHHADFRAHLATTLPDYMIPAAFVPLDAFPLTANGKLDRRALPLPERLAVSDGYLPPRNLLEEQLAAIWADCLQVERVGVRDDFFVLGGHSLLAVELMTRIRAVTGMQLPLATLFQRPTIEQLAQQQTDATAWSSLVAIRPNGTRPPLFCIHPVGGNVLSFYQFAQQQPADQPVYGLQSQGLDGQTPPLTTVEAMAAHYITEIKRVQPTGAYHLVGYSAGGAIAWEMGQQLRRAGETVAHLLIIDTPPKTAAPERDDSADAITWWLAMAHLGYQRFGTTPPFARADLEQLPADERVAFVLQTLQRDGVLPQGTAREVADGMLNVYKANTMAYDRYQMVADAGVQPVPITVVSTDGSGETWREFASSLRLISADGTHETLLTEPYLNQWMPFVDSPTESTN